MLPRTCCLFARCAHVALGLGRRGGGGAREVREVPRACCFSVRCASVPFWRTLARGLCAAGRGFILEFAF